MNSNKQLEVQLNSYQMHSKNYPVQHVSKIQVSNYTDQLNNLFSI